MTEATAGVHISGRMSVPIVVGLRMMHASSAPDNTMTAAK